MNRKRLLAATPVLVCAALLSAPSAFAQTLCGTLPFIVHMGTSVTCTTNGDIIRPNDGFAIWNRGTLDLTVGQGVTLQGRTGILSNGPTTIRNSGTILGALDGVKINEGNTTITNNGTIRSTGPQQAGVWAATGATATITNFGTIEGYFGIHIATGAHVPSSVITNRGIIRGNNAAAISLAGTGLATINNYGRIITSNSSSAGIVVNTGSTLLLNIYAGSSFEGGAAGLMMAGSGLTGSTINFHAPNYSLTVKNFLYGPGRNTVNLLSPGSLLTFAGPDTANGNGTLVVTTPAPAPAASTPSLAQASATAIQSALQMTTPRNYVPPLQSMQPDTDEYSGERAKTPGGSGPPGQSNLGMSNLGMKPRGAQTDDVPTGNAQAIDRHGNLVWARAFGAARFQPANDGIAGSINRTTGVLFGYDRQFTSWRLGAYGGYGLSNSITSEGSAKLQTQLYLAGLYGQTKLAATTFTFNLGGGILGNSSTRTITNGGEVAAADFRGAFLAPDAALAYDMRLGRGFTLTPALRARYIATFTDAYGETGSRQNIIYRDAFTSSFEERAELRLSHKQPMRNGGTFGSYVQAAAIATQRIGSGAVSANILGSEVSVQSATAGTVTGLSLGAGVDVELAKNFVTYAGIDATQYSDAAQALTGRIGLRIGF